MPVLRLCQGICFALVLLTALPLIIACGIASMFSRDHDREYFERD